MTFSIHKTTTNYELFASNSWDDSPVDTDEYWVQSVSQKDGCSKIAFYTISTEIEKGVSLMEDLSDDGLNIVTKEFIWIAGYGRASTQQAAVDYAQTDALNNASVLITEILKEEEPSSNRANHSENILKGFQPVGNVEIQYKDGMYEARAKVGMPCDRFVRYLESHYKKNSD